LRRNGAPWESSRWLTGDIGRAINALHAMNNNQSNATLGRDLLASVVVFLVALPLCLGISIASGVPPTAGIITGIVGGIIVGALAGSPLQVSGPAAGLTVLVLELVKAHGIEMLGVIVLLAGLLQFLAGSLKLGQWFRAVSPAVIQGMLAGIGVLIFAGQFHVMLDRKPLGNGVQNLLGIPGALMQTFSQGGSGVQALMLGLLTLALIVAWSSYAPKKLKVLPGPLVGVLAAVGVAALMQLKVKYIPDLLANPEDISNVWSVAIFPTIDKLKRVVEMPILIGAVSIAFIASAETLLCATAVDQMHRGPRTKYDRELAAQGIGNAICGVLGVLPMTGVIVRSSANVEAGAQTRASAILHGIWLLLFVSVLPFTLRYIPVASLAAVLVFTGYKLAYPKILPTLRKFGKGEVLIYFVTVITIVSTNLLDGVVVGLFLSLMKLLYAFSHLAIQTEQKDGRIDLHLDGAATLIRLPMLAATLETLPAGSEIHVHIGKLDYIDHACLDLLTNWDRQHQATGGSLKIEWEELADKFHQRRASGVRATQAGVTKPA
jgi:MFS superfamily sulfate permease-like transporter